MFSKKHVKRDLLVIYLLVISQFTYGGLLFENNLDPNLSDEFDTISEDLLATQNSGWQLLHADRITSVDIQQTLLENLVVVPDPTFSEAWFQDIYGPLVYKNVTGNFAVVAYGRIVSAADRTLPPTGGFNAGGFVIRDPAGTHNGDEHWVMFNFGSQGPGGYARELKKTVPAQGGAGSSRSDLYLTPQFTLDEHLAVCRIGDEFRFYTWDEIQGAWLEEHYYNHYALPQSIQNPLGVAFDEVTTNIGAGTDITSPTEIDFGVQEGERTPMRFTMTGIPTTLQVGVMGHVWSQQPVHNTRAEFEYVRFAATAPTTFDQCLNSLPIENPLTDKSDIDIPWPPFALLFLAGLLGYTGMRKLNL